MLLYKEEEKIYEERLELAESRILELLSELSEKIEKAGSGAGSEDSGGRDEFLRYFRSQFSFCNVCSKLNKYLRSGSAMADSLEEMREFNRGLYEERLPENYDVSWLNPVMCHENLGEYGQLLCVLAAELRAQIAACYERRAQELVMRM